MRCISFRITKKNLIHPSSNQRRQVEDPWDLIGRYFTVTCLGQFQGLLTDFSSLHVCTCRKNWKKTPTVHICVPINWSLSIFPGLDWGVRLNLRFTRYEIIILASWWSLQSLMVFAFKVLLDISIFILTLYRWRSGCLPTSTDSCSAGSTSGLT